jgi:predicted dehydrogenase
MVRVGLVGLGFMAATHLKAYRDVPDARVMALCNPSGRRLDGDFSDVGGNLGDGEPIRLPPGTFTAFRSYREMIADPGIDAIDICAPTFLHRELSVLALEAGKHVICEKPMARNTRDALAIVSAAHSANRVFMPAMCLRFVPEWRWLKEAVDDRRFGRVRSAFFRRIAEPPAWGQANFLDGPRSGGALFDLHIHDADFVQYCFGRPSAVQSSGYESVSGAIDHVVTQYYVAGEAMVHAEGSWAMTPGFGFNMSYLVNFENATVDYDMSRGAECLRVCARDREPEFVRLDEPDGYVGELRHFIDSVSRGKEPEVVTAEDGLSAVEICSAEELSIQNGPSAVGQLIFL